MFDWITVFLVDLIWPDSYRPSNSQSDCFFVSSNSLWLWLTECFCDLFKMACCLFGLSKLSDCLFDRFKQDDCLNRTCQSEWLCLNTVFFASLGWLYFWLRTYDRRSVFLVFVMLCFWSLSQRLTVFYNFWSLSYWLYFLSLYSWYWSYWLTVVLVFVILTDRISSFCYTDWPFFQSLLYCLTVFLLFYIQSDRFSSLLHTGWLFFQSFTYCLTEFLVFVILTDCFSNLSHTGWL